VLRNVMLVLALVGAFQAGRLMPARTAWSPQVQSGTAYAQTAPPADGELEAFADRVALEALLQLGARAPVISEALRLEMSELTALIQQRLGPEVEQLQAQAVASQSILTRSQAVLDRSDRAINDSKDVIDDTNETLDETEDVLNDSEDLLDDSENTLDDSEELLNETRKTLERSRALMREAEALTAEAQDLLDRFAADVEDIRTIIDRLPVGP
jgi:hypothetical protein